MCKSWKSELMQKLLVRSQMSYFAWLAVKQSSRRPLHNNTTSVWCLSWAHLRIAATSRLRPSTGKSLTPHCDILHANILLIQEHQILISYSIICKYKWNNVSEFMWHCVTHTVPSAVGRSCRKSLLINQRRKEALFLCLSTFKMCAVVNHWPHCMFLVLLSHPLYEKTHNYQRKDMRFAWALYSSARRQLDARLQTIALNMQLDSCLHCFVRLYITQVLQPSLFPHTLKTNSNYCFLHRKAEQCETGGWQRDEEEIKADIDGKVGTQKTRVPGLMGWVEMKRLRRRLTWAERHKMKSESRVGDREMDSSEWWLTLAFLYLMSPVSIEP